MREAELVRVDNLYESGLLLIQMIYGRMETSILLYYWALVEKTD